MSYHRHHKIKKSALLLIGALTLGFFALLVSSFPTPAAQLAHLAGNSGELPEKVELRIRNIVVKAELARTEEEKRRGLSGRPRLGEFEGLLFAFGRDSRPSFWMKDMAFPIDIFWIDKGLKIVGISKNISPESFPKVFPAPQPVRFVLEVNAEFADRYNIIVGDRLAPAR